MNKNLIIEKQIQVRDILKENNIDMWMIFTRESSINHDPSLDIVVGTNVTWQSAFCFPVNDLPTAIIGSLEVPNMKMVGTFENVIGYLQSVREPLREYLQKINPDSIAINYSVNSNLADGLTHGMYLNLLKHLEGTPFQKKIISSENVIAALRGRKSATELENMKKAISITEKIFDDVTSFVKPGMTEKEVAGFIKEKVKELGLEIAWDEEHCPAVFTGPESAGAHAGPTDRKIQKGHLMNIDFGVKFNGYCSDMQRTWYFKKDNEDLPPIEVMRGFDILKKSIRLAKEAIKPGVQGCEVDDIARNYITQNGYEEYKHGLGHQLGRSAHDGGAGLFPRWERYGNLPFLSLEINQVFTIEPRLYVDSHGIVTMEEEIVVTENGCEWLTNPQEELIVIE